MSNNFYWIEQERNVPTVSVTPANGDTLEVDTEGLISEDNPRIHIGKSSLNSFSWAQDPKKVREQCEADPDSPLVRDELGQRFTGSEFLARIAGYLDVTKHVGTVFC